MYLNNYSTGDYTVGASFLKQVLWFYLGDYLVQTKWIPIASFKVFILRLFGAKIGKKVNIKPGVKIKHPWRLVVGDYSWIGENVWIDNLVLVTIGPHCCVSQGAYFCTGNHSWSKANFNLITGTIQIEAGSWIGAKAVVGPGVTVQQGAVLCMGAVATQTLQSMHIYAGNPCQVIKVRQVEE
ncbi:MAG: WcaF family extracellular polysaccharide biosynthesis acetyltransferase [Synechocystis sp.]